jgi:hypothetical protein
MDMIKFPVLFDGTGFQKHVEGSNEYYSQLLTISMLTEPRTHPFSPKFGVLDPSFRGIDKGVFVLNAARFVPEVEITKINTDIDPTDGTTKIEFTFQIKEEAL